MFLDYLPYMVFTNMFAIFYLETICMTKTTAAKQKDDKWMGHLINIMITAFFVIIFILPTFLSSVGLYNVEWNMNDESWRTDNNYQGIGYTNMKTTFGNFNLTYV